MAIKKYKVRFFGATVGTGQTKASELLENLSIIITTNKVGPSILLGEHKYQMRELTSLNNGKTYKGAFAKLRDDAPHIADEAGSEKPISLNADEHLIEKNYFLYFAEHELLVYQTNFSASDCSKLGQYLTNFAAGKSTVVFSDVLRPEALKKLLNGQIKSLEVAFAKPKKLANYANESNWSKNVMDLLKGSGAGRIVVKVSTRSTTQALSGELKSAIQEFFDNECTRTLKVKLADVERPIDLIAEAVRDEIEVVMDGIYPNPVSIYAELDKAKDRQKEDLNDYFQIT